jgi:nucleotide-binding universal stress UspA family protein
MSATAMMTARPRGRRVGVVAVFLTDRESDEAVLDAAVATAVQSQARLTILAVPRHVPITAQCISPGFVAPFNMWNLKAEAEADAALAAKHAADSVRDDIRVEYRVVTVSLIQAIDELAQGASATHIVFDRRLLARRRGRRRALIRWQQSGVSLSAL